MACPWWCVKQRKFASASHRALRSSSVSRRLGGRLKGRVVLELPQKETGVGWHGRRCRAARGRHGSILHLMKEEKWRKGMNTKCHHFSWAQPGGGWWMTSRHLLYFLGGQLKQNLSTETKGWKLEAVGQKWPAELLFLLWFLFVHLVGLSFCFLNWGISTYSRIHTFRVWWVWVRCVTCTTHQNSAPALESFLRALCSQFPSLLPVTGSHWPASSGRSIAYSRISREWNYTELCLLRINYFHQHRAFEIHLCTISILLVAEEHAVIEI